MLVGRKTHLQYLEGIIEDTISETNENQPFNFSDQQPTTSWELQVPVIHHTFKNVWDQLNCDRPR